MRCANKKICFRICFLVSLRKMGVYATANSLYNRFMYVMLTCVLNSVNWSFFVLFFEPLCFLSEKFAIKMVRDALDFVAWYADF